TAWQNFWEVRKVYKLWVVCVPTNRPVIRQNQPDRVFATEEKKFLAVAGDIKRMRDKGRPGLGGTRPGGKSEKVSQLLTELGVAHQVLNARPEVAENEAEIIAQAGRPGTVTIATNMAGRGTDIILGGNPEAMAWSRLHKKYNHRHDVPPEE